MTVPRPTDDQLYRLLPAIYRIRDAARGEPLRALLAIIQQELQVVEADIDALYDNWFIETCQDWVVPYIGDLLDVGELDAGNPARVGLNSDPGGDRDGGYGQQERRAYVANTLAYRRRKGTMPVLEQLTQDITGWRSRAVEFGRLVNTTQNLERIRPNSTTVNLRANDRLEQIGTPFEQQAAYSVDLRPVRQGGRYSLPNVGLHVWRLQSYPLERVQARAVVGSEAQITGQYYTFNPVGPEQVPLFNQPQTKVNITSLAAEINLPAILRRPVLADELAQRRQLLSQGQPLKGRGYFDSDPVIAIFIDGQPQPLPPEVILITDLAAAEPVGLNTGSLPWRSAAEIPWRGAESLAAPPAYLVAVDPERGRLVMRPGFSPVRVEVSYFYGFSGDVGGGPYSRIAGLPRELDATRLSISPWHWSVQQASSGDRPPLAAAIAAWNRTVTVRYGLRVGTHVPLGLIQVPPIRVVKVLEAIAAAPPEFKPGVVRGLTVERGLCPNDLVVRSGLAIDRHGRRLHLPVAWSFDGAARFQEIIRQLPDGTGILVLYYRPAERGNAVEVGLVPESALAGYAPGTMIPLAQLRFDRQNNLESLRPVAADSSFQPGILQGLVVQNPPNRLAVVITPGTAVDAEGNGLVLAEPYSLALDAYQGSQVRIILRPSERGDRRIQLLPLTTPLPDGSYIQLAQLEIPEVILGQIETHPERIGRPLEIEKTGLDLIPGLRTIQLEPGTLQVSADRALAITAPQSIDLSAYAGRTLLLFLSDQPDQGWPLEFTQPPEAEEAYVGLIPVAPPAEADTTDPLGLKGVDTGWIVIQDSGTYRGDLTIAVPPSSRLHLLAANGDRPHLQGNIAIQGWSRADQAPGELLLNGLLIAGCLQVLPGSLGQLSLEHCTLVPRLGGIQVCGDDGEGTACDDDDFSLLAFVAYCLVAIWRLIGQDLGLKANASPMSLSQFLHASWQQLVAGMAAALSAAGTPTRTLPWGNIPFEDTDHDQLEISLYRTLSGPLYLSDTVPKLRIEASVIDKGRAADSSAVAIAAPGTAIAMQATTVLGRTTAWQLEASDCLFTEKVTVERHQTGCIRFSYVPVASSTPRRYRCQPDLALQAALDHIPRGISALGLLSGWGATSDDQPYQVLAATAGDGIFRLLQSRDQSQSTATWAAAHGDLPDRQLTALAAYRWPQPAQPPADLAQRAELLVGTATGQIFRLVSELTENLAPESFAWRLLPLAQVNAAITSLHADPLEGTGTVTVSSQGSPASVPIQGQGTRFSKELQVGDVMITAGETEGLTWRVERLGRPSDGRTLTVDGRRATGAGADFAADLEAGDTITLQRQLQLGEQRQTITQTRTVVDIKLAENEVTLTLNAPFGPAIGVDEPQPFIINIDTELTATRMVLQPSEATATSLDSGVSFTILRLWATTAGGGIWRGAIDGQTWQAFNTGLTNLSLSAVDRDADHRLWVGTQGDGVFRLTSEATGDRWIAASQGLTTGDITDLTHSQGDLLAATTDGIFSFDADRNTWYETSDGLTSRDITVLAAGNQAGSFWAGSRDGKVFRSTDRGMSWCPLSLDLRGTDITALAVEANSGDIWVGTAAGEVFRFHAQSECWQSIQAGRSELATKLQVLNQMQPSFTSTRYGHPGYVQLSLAGPAAIRTGAENGAELGVFNYLRQPQREANLLASLDEYLRFGMAAGIFYMT